MNNVIVIAEDDTDIRNNLARLLRMEGFTVHAAPNGREGYALAQMHSPDMVLSDVTMPEMTGHELVKAMRSNATLAQVPVVLLTARADRTDVREGMNLGADDYLTKPFYIEELIARLHVVTRRASGSSHSILEVADLTINLLTREVVRGGRKIELTAREFELLEHLARSPGRVLTRAQICERVWSYDFDPGTNLVEVYIQRLRKKVDAESADKLIETIRGVGYRMKSNA